MFHQVAKEMCSRSRPVAAPTNKDSATVRASFPKDIDRLAHPVEVNALDRIQQLGSVLFGVFHKHPSSACEICANQRSRGAKAELVASSRMTSRQEDEATFSQAANSSQVGSSHCGPRRNGSLQK